MNLRRGCVFEENPREGTPLVQVKAHLPVSESFGFVAALRQATSGQAFPQCVFDHWENLPGDCLQDGSKMQELILNVRKRKNLKVEMPKAGDYLDKLQIRRSRVGFFTDSSFTVAVSALSLLGFLGSRVGCYASVCLSARL